MIKIKEAIVVEGNYDKIRLSSIVDTTIITSGGFRIFSDAKLLGTIKQLAQKRGVIIFTDSDRAGFLIRNYLKSQLPPSQVKHAYIPDVKGKEKRKSAHSKEGFLGVEGIDNKTLEDILLSCTTEAVAQSKFLTKTMLFEDGLTGGENSHELRQKLCQELGLPKRLSTNALIDILNSILTIDEYKFVLNKISPKSL